MQTGRENYLRRNVICSIILLSLFAMVPFTSAQTILAQSDDILLDPVEITAAMSPQGITIITFNALMTNQGPSDVSEFTLRVDSLEANVLSAVVNGTSTGAYATPLDRYTTITVSLPTAVAQYESVWLTIRVRALDLQSDPYTGADPAVQLSDFIFYVRPLDAYHNFTFTATLPEEALLSEESVVPIFPDNDLNFTDGRSLSFAWFTPLLQPGQERVYIIKYQLQCTENGPLDGSPLLLLVGLIIGIAAGAAGVYFGPTLISRFRKIGKVRFVGVTNEEEEILDVIREKGGSCSQKDLYTGTDMSQAKVSLLLNNLEERGLVRRFREGRENVVHIMEE